MAFFDSVRSKLADFGQDVANQTKAMAETAKLKEKIASEEKELNKKYQALGRAYYVRQASARAQGARLLLEDISAFEGIENSLKKISELNQDLEKVKNGG
ncbi:MAG: hypothetical protein IIY45_12925 [Firmicutes bacterium]|jgi:hypothetical protein|nr:hypothetical protein [Bacillota bacterium]